MSGLNGIADPLCSTIDNRSRIELELCPRRRNELTQRSPFHGDVGQDLWTDLGQMLHPRRGARDEAKLIRFIIVILAYSGAIGDTRHANLTHFETN